MPDYSIIYETTQGQFKTVVPCCKNGLEAENKLRKKCVEYPILKVLSVNIHTPIQNTQGTKEFEAIKDVFKNAGLDFF